MSIGNNQPTYRLDNDSMDRIIRDQLIHKDNQLKNILKKYIDITSPSEQLSDERLQNMILEFNREVQVYEFQISKAGRQLVAQTFDREQNQELSNNIKLRTENTGKEIEALKSVYSVEESIKKNKQLYEELSEQIKKFDDCETVSKQIDSQSSKIENLQAKHKTAMKMIKKKEKQLQLMLHLMSDLILTQ